MKITITIKERKTPKQEPFVLFSISINHDDAPADWGSNTWVDHWDFDTCEDAINAAPKILHRTLRDAGLQKTWRR